MGLRPHHDGASAMCSHHRGASMQGAHHVNRGEAIAGEVIDLARFEFGMSAVAQARPEGFGFLHRNQCRIADLLAAGTSSSQPPRPPQGGGGRRLGALILCIYTRLDYLYLCVLSDVEVSFNLEIDVGSGFSVIGAGAGLG